MTKMQSKMNPLEKRSDEANLIQNKMNKIKHKIAIISGKGGVGKSLVTVNLATMLKIGTDRKVGIFDADLTGPCVPKMLGIKGSRLKAAPLGINPVVGPLGIEVVSRIPFDNVVTEALVKGLPVVEYSDNSVSQQIKALWQSIAG